MNILPWQGFEDAVIVEGGSPNETMPMHLALHRCELHMIVLVLGVVRVLDGIVVGLCVLFFRFLSNRQSLGIILALRRVLLKPISLVLFYFWSVSVPVWIILRRLSGLICLLAADCVVHLDHLVPPEADRVLPPMLLDLRDHLVNHAGTPTLHDFLAPPLDG